MPVRSSTSSVIKWPDRAAVDAAARRWVAAQRERHPELLRAGYFGSYARGDWGVGSDLDLIVIVEQTPRIFAERPLDWDTLELPVPVDLLVYTREEWERLLAEGTHFAVTVQGEALWIFDRLL
ncbi:nucleotidyltransferase domain-containing protein [Methylotetracoccus oryzae]|uniref:nucleotidyltransferase domain-containing protein n=1 Tax=Methylotetracoccus oryzae TaxID=1919059 RepID=UPI00111A22FB|nr:nucleotidyltransferase domain-containing protein [Methylotetracoccus oryzae]